MRAGLASRLCAPGERGFTLLELLIVVVLASLTMGFAGLTFTGYFQSSSARGAAQVFARDLALARSAAIRAKEPVVVRFYEANRWYQVVARSSGTELVRRRFGVNAEVELSAINLKFEGDTLVFDARGVADLSTLDKKLTLGEASFKAGPTQYTVTFNSLGASKVEER